MTQQRLTIIYSAWIGGSLVLSAALWWLVIAPQQQALLHDVTAIGTASETFNKIDATTKQYIAGQEQLDTLEQAMATIKASYISPTSPFTFVDLVETIANQHTVTANLHIADYVPSTIPHEAVTVPVTFTITGQGNNVLSFVSDILRQPVELTPTLLDIKSTGPDAVEATLEVNSYWL